MCKRQIQKYLILLSFLGSIYAQKEQSYEELLSVFKFEREIGNLENAERHVQKLISILELDPKLSKETFAIQLEFFAEFYLEIENDSISNLLFYRSAKIYENEILKFQKYLFNPIQKLDEIYISNSYSFFQSPYSQLLNELNDSNRFNQIDTTHISTFVHWFPEIRYLDYKSDTIQYFQEQNNEAIELANIAITYYNKGLYQDALELLSQAVKGDDQYLNYEFLTTKLFINSDSTQLFLNEITENNKLNLFSPEKKLILALAFFKIEENENTLPYVLKFQQKYPNELRTYLILGDIYFKQENWFESLLNYHWAIQKSPNHIIAKIGLSLSMMHREDFQGARIILEKLIKNDLLDFRVYLALGEIYFYENKIELAIQQFNIALDLEPNNAKIHFNIGRAHLKFGRLSQALDAFTESTKLEKENGEYHYFLGQVYEKILNIDEAIKNYKITRKFNPEITEVNRKLGLLLFEKELYRKAVEPLRDYIIFNPDSTRILSLFSEVLIYESRYPEAIDAYTRLIKKESGNIKYYLQLAKAYKELNKLENAMIVYEEALKYNDELSELYIDLSYVSYELGYYNKTIHYLEESMKCIEPDFNTNYLLGLAYGNLNKNMQAVLAFKQAELLDSTDITISFQTGVLYMGLLLFDEALLKFENYASNYPRDQVTQFLIGKCLYNLGEYDSAISTFKYALRLNQNDSDSQYYIGLCLKQIGDLESSAIALKKATLLNPDNHLYHFEIGQVYLAIGKLRLAYNEANILQLLKSTYFDSLNSLIQFNVAEKDSSINIELEID
jgi:tetratricopeptide (TPR) repeat protein